MIPSIDCIVTGGNQNASGEILIWGNHIADQPPFSLFREKSEIGISTLAVSPDGTHLAAGFQNGRIKVWPFLDQDLAQNPEFILDRFNCNNLSVPYSIAFLTNDLIVTSGEGKLGILSIEQQKNIHILNAHQGPVLSVVAMGSKVAASLGVDGYLKIWDMDSLSCEFQKKLFALPFKSVPALSFSQETGYLCCPSPDGILHLFNLHKSAEHETLSVHQGQFLSSATSGKYIVTGGFDDGRLKLWDMDTKKAIKTVEAGASVFRLSNIGKEKVAVILNESKKTKRLQLFSIPALEPAGDFNSSTLGTVAAVPLPTIEHRRTIELIQFKTDLINKAREHLKDPQRMAPYLDQLAQIEFTAEAKILQAESARVRNKPPSRTRLPYPAGRYHKSLQRYCPFFSQNGRTSSVP